MCKKFCTIRCESESSTLFVHFQRPHELFRRARQQMNFSQPPANSYEFAVGRYLKLLRRKNNYVSKKFNKIQNIRSEIKR